jgi:hypothetical protein
VVPATSIPDCCCTPFLTTVQDFLRAARPITVVALGHNGMNRALQRLQALHPRMHFAALAPHVATAMREVLHIHTHWMMATMPVNSSVRAASLHITSHHISPSGKAHTPPAAALLHSGLAGCA